MTSLVNEIIAFSLKRRRDGSLGKSLATKLGILSSIYSSHMAGRTARCSLACPTPTVECTCMHTDIHNKEM